MKSAIEKHQDYYCPVEKPANNKRGFKVEYVYYGQWCSWDTSGDEMKTVRIRLTAGLLISTAMFLGASLIPCEANRCLFVAIPSTANICALIYEIIGVVRFDICKARIAEPDWYSINRTVKFSTLIHTVCMGISCLGAIVYMAMLQIVDLSVLAAILYLVSSLAAFAEFRVYVKLKLHTEENENLALIQRDGLMKKTISDDEEGEKTESLVSTDGTCV